jgi:predicted XRE-type DNA-binding protein
MAFSVAGPALVEGGEDPLVGLGHRLAVVGAVLDAEVLPGGDVLERVAEHPEDDAARRFGHELVEALVSLNDLRTEAGLSQRALATRMGTTQSVISRLEEGGGAKNRLDTLARVAVALDRHLVVSFPQQVPAELKDAVQVA